MKASRRLVIDASVAHAAGDSKATVPIAKNCRDFLEAVLSICLRAVFAIVWINPNSEEDAAIDWLRQGAKPEPTRRLGHRPKGKR
jgi:hypothetical protein